MRDDQFDGADDLAGATQHDIRAPRVRHPVLDDDIVPIAQPVEHERFLTVARVGAPAHVRTTRSVASGPAAALQRRRESQLHVDMERGFRLRRGAHLTRIVSSVVATHVAELEREPSCALRAVRARSLARRHMRERRDVAWAHRPR